MKRWLDIASQICKLKKFALSIISYSYFIREALKEYVLGLFPKLGVVGGLKNPKLLVKTYFMIFCCIFGLSKRFSFS